MAPYSLTTTWVDPIPLMRSFKQNVPVTKKFIHLNNLNRLIRWYWYNMKFNYTSIICSYLLLFLNLTNQKKSNLKHSYIFLYFRKRNPPTPPLPPPKKKSSFSWNSSPKYLLIFREIETFKLQFEKEKKYPFKNVLKFFYI